jgi:hypothetical protein
VRRLAVRQAPVQISGKFFPLSLLAMDKNHGEWKWMNGTYECNGMYVLKISKLIKRVA